MKMIEAYKGAEVEVTYEECEVIREISRSIGSNVEVTPPKVVIREDNFRHMINTYGTEESIEYAAENLERLSEDEVNGISPEMFEKVLKSEKLKIKLENSLFEIASKFIESNRGECIGLLSLVEIKFLGIRERSEYIGIVRRWAERNFMDIEFAKVLDSLESFVKGEIFTKREFHLDDIISESGIGVDITVSSENFPKSPKRNLEGFKNQNDDCDCLVTKDFKNSWIQWDFNNCVAIQSYEIECSKDGDGINLRNWKVEVSDNGTDWDTVDKKQNQTQLTKGTKTKFSIETPNYARYLRLTQMEMNSSGCYYLVVKNVKFEGLYKKR